jgi:hypothetical protein
MKRTALLVLFILSMPPLFSAEASAMALGLTTIPPAIWAICHIKRGYGSLNEKPTVLSLTASTFSIGYLPQTICILSTFSFNAWALNGVPSWNLKSEHKKSLLNKQGYSPIFGYSGLNSSTNLCEQLSIQFNLFSYTRVFLN